MTIDLKRSFLESEIEQYAEAHSMNADDAFMYWFYHQLFNLDDDELAPDEDVIDGAGEKQIDLFRIDADDSEGRAKITIIQVKNTQGFSSNVVAQMRNGLDIVFKSKKSEVESLKNLRLREKIFESKQWIKEYGNNNIDVECLYVSLGDDHGVSHEAEENRKVILSAYGEGAAFGEFSFSFVGVHELDRLLNLRRNRARRIDHDLPIIYDANRPSIVEFESAGVRSLLCTVAGHDLAVLAQKEPRDAVFDANVRGHLGLGGRVNKNIYSSSCDNEKASLFWFMNNGITMVCDEFSIVRDPDNPSVKIRNLQIINGCQTTSSIRAAFEEGVLSTSLKVQLKIYSSKDHDFVSQVVVATNNQNAIGTRDLHANDEVQKLIQKRVQEDYGLFYERKRGEAKSHGIPKSQVIDLEKAGQAYIAVFKRQPTVSRAQKYKVFSSDFCSGVYEKGQPWQLAVSHELHKYVEGRGRKASKDLATSDPNRNILNYGAFHVTRILWWVLEYEMGKSAENHKEIIEDIRMESDYIVKSYTRATELLTDIVKNNNDTMVNLNNYFKKAQSQQDINKQLSALEVDALLS